VTVHSKHQLHQLSRAPLAFSSDINSEFNLLNDNPRWLCATINNNQKTDREAAMRQFMMTVMALAAFGTVVVTAQAENQTARPSQVKSAASKARFNSYDVCEKKAHDISLAPGHVGHARYIAQCMGQFQGWPDPHSATCTGMTLACLSHEQGKSGDPHFSTFPQMAEAAQERALPYAEKFATFTGKHP
jgi:hypothetical protein